MTHKKRKHIFLKLLILLAAVCGALLLDSNYRISVEEYELSYDNLPAAFDGFRVVSLTDIHAAEFGEGNGRLIKAVSGAEPDIICVVGDLIDGEGEGDIVCNLMQKLVRIAPVYYVTGNHEWDSGQLPQLREILAECGVTMLENKYVTIERDGEEIILAGAEDPNGYADQKTPEELAEEIRRDRGDGYIMFMYHRNNRLEEFSRLGVDTVLSGHAHGGIVRLPFTDGLVGPNREIFPSYTSGVYSMGATDMVVSRGLGNHTGFPRFLNNPHIPVIILRTK